MKINDYITQNQLTRVDTTSLVRPGFVLTLLTDKFNAGDEVEYYASGDKSRYVGICRVRNFFAAARPGMGVTTGALNESYPTLRSF